MARRVSWKHSLVVVGSMAAGIAALAFIGCGGGGGTTKPQTATSAVTPQAGGTVTLPDNSARLDIPAGAVSSTTMITVSTSDAAAPSGVMVDGQILKFEPDGLVFSKPVTVTFAIKSATHPTVYWSNASGGYDSIGGTVTGSSIAAQVMHFSSGFVAEVAGAAATCAPGASCAAGKTCSYGGSAPINGGGGTDTTGAAGKTGGSEGPGAADAGAPSSGSSSSTGGTSGGSAPLDPGSKGSEPPATAKLSSGSDTGGASSGTSVAMCCMCGSDGKLACSACGGGASDGKCGEGLACGAPGTTCSLSEPAGNTNTGPISGAAGAGAAGASGSSSSSGGTSGGSAPLDPGSPGPAKASALGAATCCTCGADGLFHCADKCSGGDSGTGPIGGADAGAPPARADGGSTIDPGAGGECAPGAPCAAGAAGCKNASPGSCMACQCVNGHYECSSCAGPDAGTGGPISSDGDAGAPLPKPDGGALPPQECIQAGVCTTDCLAGGTSAGTCSLACKCHNGHLDCAPCGADVDASIPPPRPDAGAPQPIQECAPGAACAEPGLGCGGGGAGSCMKCMCGDDLKLTCTPC